MKQLFTLEIMSIPVLLHWWCIHYKARIIYELIYGKLKFLDPTHIYFNQRKASSCFPVCFLWFREVLRWALYEAIENTWCGYRKAKIKPFILNLSLLYLQIGRNDPSPFFEILKIVEETSGIVSFSSSLTDPFRDLKKKTTTTKTNKQKTAYHHPFLTGNLFAGVMLVTSPFPA